MSLPAGMVAAVSAAAVVPVRTPVSQQAVDLTIAQVRRDYADQVGVKASTAEGGQARVFVSWRHRQLAAAGYGGWRRGAGLEAGGEVTWDLRPK